MNSRIGFENRASARISGWHRLLVAVSACIGIFCVGCESSPDTNTFQTKSTAPSLQHTPRPGMGAIIVNDGFALMDVYVDGALVGTLDDSQSLAYDTPPGTHELKLLFQKDDYKDYKNAEIPVETGMNTIIDVIYTSEMDPSPSFHTTVKHVQTIHIEAP
jgi:hypothetical protein